MMNLFTYIIILYTKNIDVFYKCFYKSLANKLWKNEKKNKKMVKENNILNVQSKIYKKYENK